MNRSLLKISALAGLWLSVLPLFSCTSGAAPESTVAGSGVPVKVYAEKGRLYTSRAYYDESTVVASGQYWMTYPKAETNDLAVALVDFENPAPSVIGIVTAPDGSELMWNMVGGGANPTFMLDNVSTALDVNNVAGAPSTTVTFAGDNNPFVAAPFDDVNGSNDLLWGTKQAAHTLDRIIEFDLHHYMSRVRVQITTDEEFVIDNGDLDLTDAVVEITSLVHRPVSYNRMDGSLSLGENPGHETLVLIDPEDDELCWQSIETDGENEYLHVYTTRDFVLPPQGLLEDENRPRLTIRLKNGRVYSGILPHAMEVDYSDDREKYPVTLYFLKEHILTIKTLITEAPPTLEFMPVDVVEWVDKGSFTLEGHQAGIYKAEDLYNMVKNYETYNEFQLGRFGYIDSKTGLWVFNFYHGVVADPDEIEGRMADRTDKPGFVFQFNGYVNVLKDKSGKTEELKGTEGESRLYQLVTTPKP